MLNLCIRFILMFACITSTFIVVAEEMDELYQVEVIFFEHLDPKRFSVEEWPKFVGKLNLETAVALDSDVSAENMLLNEEVKILKRSKDQRFIDHIAWHEPLMVNFSSTPAYIQAGKHNQEVKAVLDITPMRNIFNINIDVIYISQNGSEFRVKRSLKIKAKQMYYIDNPIIGCMLMISKIST